MPDPTPNPKPAAVPSIPPALEKLLAIYPAEVRDKFRKVIADLHLTNPNDPIFELMIVLGLWGTYYQRISGEIAATGAKIVAGHTTALEKFDEELLMLEGLSQSVRDATARLENIPGEIIQRFPAQAIAAAVLKKVDEQIQALPLETFHKQLKEVQGELHVAANKAENSADRLNNAATRMETAADAVNALKMPRLSFWTFIITVLVGVAIGAALTFGGMWWWKARPEVAQARNFLRNEAYIGNRASAGMMDGNQVIVIPTTDIASADPDGKGNTVIRLKKEAP